MAAKRSGRLAPAFFAFALLLVGTTPGQVFGQQLAPTGQPPVSSVPVPGDLELAKMVWSTMAAVDHGNQAGNYSVLRDLAAPGFQINNDAAALAQIFASLRASRLDLSNTLLLAPTYRAAPSLVQPGVIRVQGYFGLRPTAIDFDLYYQWIGGRWRLFGVSISPTTIASEQPAMQRPAQTLPPRPAQPRPGTPARQTSPAPPRG